MKIVFISTYQGKVERGVENYVTELARRLGRKHQVKILTSFWQLFDKRAVTFQKRPGPPADGSGLKIIYPMNGYWQSLGCRIYSWLIGAKLVLGGHAGIGRDDRWNLYMFPDVFIAFSQKGYEWAKKVNPWIKVVNIPHGVDLETFNPGVKPKKLDLERPIFITVSHLLPYKRVGESVKAVAGLAKGSLLVLGEGPLEKEIDELGNRLLNGLSSRSRVRRGGGDLTDSEIATSPSTAAQAFGSEAQARRGPRNDIKRKRYLRLAVSHREVPSYLTASDVFTLVSGSQEAFGLVYLEALACNLPVVATDDSLRRELIGEAGVFVNNPEDSQEYARCLEESAKINWGDKPLKQAKKFDWEKITKEYNNFLSQLKTHE